MIGAVLWNRKGLASETISALGQIVRGDTCCTRAECPGGTHPALGQNVLGGIWKLGTIYSFGSWGQSIHLEVGDNLFTAGPLTVSLGLNLATYCGIIDDGMMTVTLAAARDPMIRFLDR